RASRFLQILLVVVRESAHFQRTTSHRLPRPGFGAFQSLVNVCKEAWLGYLPIVQNVDSGFRLLADTFGNSAPDPTFIQLCVWSSARHFGFHQIEKILWAGKTADVRCQNTRCVRMLHRRFHMTTEKEIVARINSGLLCRVSCARLSAMISAF